MKTIQEIDLLKYKIEQKYIGPLQKIFNHIARDAKAFYLMTGKIPAQELSKNYNPEFLKIIRDAQREAIKTFGFDIREDGEAKGYGFKTMKYKALINYHIETKDIDALNQDGPLEKINRTFAFDSALYVANTSEDQVEYIDRTNQKDIEDAEKAAALLFFQQHTAIREDIASIEEAIRKIDWDVMMGESQSLAAAKKKKLQERLEESRKKLSILEAEKNKIIADNIERQLIEKGSVRSPLIASQNVGMATSWSRNREAELVTQNIPETTKVETWRAILDSHTRDDHAAADGQVKQNGHYVVGGHQCKYPMDPALPIEQTANCRCQEEIKIEFKELL